MEQLHFYYSSKPKVDIIYNKDLCIFREESFALFFERSALFLE